MATEAVWLHRGKVKMQGDVETTTEQYLNFQSQASEKAQLLSEDHDDS
jgi:ABC-type polysaccharide/polyol phosphate transport system ATPase subunit